MGDSSTGSFVGYLTAAFMLPKPIRQISDANSLIQKGIVAAESIFEVLDEEIEKDSGNYVVDSVNGEVEYQNVMFSYGDGKKF